jgi:hypothetical protein
MNRLIVISLAVVTVASAWVGAASGGIFYVSPSGNDRANGRSVEHPWRTIHRVNNARLQPGDVVLFQAKATFSDSTLTPGASGVDGDPISFGSYGSGEATISNADGAVWFSGRDYLTFQNLRLTTGNADGVIFAGSSGKSTHITLKESILFDSNYAAINQPGSDDASWTIRDNVISHVGDSGMILAGSHDLVRGNTIKDVGWNPALDYGKHGIYAKGVSVRIVANRISGFPNGNGISLRSRDALVSGNTISDGPMAIAFFPEDSQVGTSVVSGNHARGITRSAFYYDTGGGEDFVLAGSPTARMLITGNRLLGTFQFALSARYANGAGFFTESKNAFAGSPVFAWGGRALSFGRYRALSGQGAGDRVGLH